MTRPRYHILSRSNLILYTLKVRVRILVSITPRNRRQRTVIWTYLVGISAWSGRSRPVRVRTRSDQLWILLELCCYVLEFILMVSSCERETDPSFKRLSQVRLCGSDNAMVLIGTLRWIMGWILAWNILWGWMAFMCLVFVFIKCLTVPVLLTFHTLVRQSYISRSVKDWYSVTFL